MKTRYKYLITIGVGLLMTFCVALIKDIFNQTIAKKVFGILTDSFFTSGVIIAGYGLLIFASNEGTFDMLAFGIVKLVDLFRKPEAKAKRKTFFDYREAKKDSKKSFSYILIVGLGLIAISLLFLVLYY